MARFRIFSDLHSEFHRDGGTLLSQRCPKLLVMP